MRIVTAREQAEMLLPWRHTARFHGPRRHLAAGSQIHRVMELGYPGNEYGIHSHPSWDRVPDLLNHDPNQELGPLILNGLERGLGKHWSNSSDYVRNGYWGGNPVTIGDFQVAMSADHPGGEQEQGDWYVENRGMHPEEDEFTVLDHTPLTVRDLAIKTRGDNAWRPVPMAQPWSGKSTHSDTPPRHLDWGDD